MLKIKNINKKYREFELKDISLDISHGDYFVILGKSGAGKSILLELVAGIIKPDSGTIILNSLDITKSRIQDRKIGLVFQDFALFPHYKVKDNIAYPMVSMKVDKEEINKTVIELAKKTGIEHLLNRYPKNLSGGEKQRVALARTLANNPICLLLDEPLASLDVQLKEDLRELLRSINQMGITIVHVTHDYEEAIALANRVAVMNDGEIIQSGEIHNVFQKPKNDFVARFTGLKNFFDAEILENNIACVSDSVSIQLAESKRLGKVRIIIESKHIIVSTDKLESTATNSFSGKIVKIVTIPSGYELTVNVGILLAVKITRESNNKFQFKVGQSVMLSFKASEVQVIY